MDLDSNGSPRRRRSPQLPEELADLVDFLKRLFLLLVVILGPGVAIVWLMMNVVNGSGSHDQGSMRLGYGMLVAGLAS